MPKAENNSAALVVINDARVTQKNKLASFQKKTAKQVGLIERTERENVARRLFVGLALHILKESFGHGNGWTEWKEKHVLTQISKGQLHYIMAAAQRWVEKSGVEKPEVAALPGGNFSLKVKDGPGKKLASSAVAFVDGLTWGELLEREEIRDGAPQLGGARPTAKKGGKAPSAEQLYLFARDEIGSAIETVERVFLKDNLLQHLADHPEEVTGVAESLRKVADEVEKAAKPLLKK